MIRITFSKSHVKRLQKELEKACACGDGRAVQRASILLIIGNHIALETFCRYGIRRNKRSTTG